MIKTKSLRRYTVAQMRGLTGLGNATLKKYTQLAGVKTPKRGGRNHCFPAEEAHKILQTILDQSSDEAIRKRCLASLEKLKIAQKEIVR